MLIVPPVRASRRPAMSRPHVDRDADQDQQRAALHGLGAPTLASLRSPSHGGRPIRRAAPAAPSPSTATCPPGRAPPRPRRSLGPSRDPHAVVAWRRPPSQPKQQGGELRSGVSRRALTLNTSMAPVLSLVVTSSLPPSGVNATWPGVVRNSGVALGSRPSARCHGGIGASSEPMLRRPGSSRRRGC